MPKLRKATLVLDCHAVEQVRQLRAEKTRLRVIAEQLGVSISTVFNAVNAIGPYENVPTTQSRLRWNNRFGM